MTIDSKGRSRLSFMMPNGERRDIRLGRLAPSIAAVVKHHVESIITTARYGVSLPASTNAWLNSIDEEFYGRLAKVGLVEPCIRLPLAEFVGDWIDARDDIKPYTRRSLTASLRAMVDYFGPDKCVDEVTAAEALAFRNAMATRYARATVGRTVKHGRQFFKAAIAQGLIESNPFATVQAWACENAARKVHVDRSTIEAVLAAEHQPRFKRLIALARYGGLRVPSEIAPLDWKDIDWEKNRFVVREHKTRTRTVPLFPELRAVLEPGRQVSGPVVDGCESSTNWRTHFLNVIKRAGRQPWPRLFHNLRASRETELVAEFPLHVVCEWIGNSEIVATRHYLTVRESDYERAAGTTVAPASNTKDA